MSFLLTLSSIFFFIYNSSTLLLSFYMKTLNLVCHLYPVLVIFPSFLTSHPCFLAWTWYLNEFEFINAFLRYANPKIFCGI